jgi:hypothetical protein
MRILQIYSVNIFYQNFAGSSASEEVYRRNEMKKLCLFLAVSLAAAGVAFGGGRQSRSGSSSGPVNLEIFPEFGHVEYIEESPWYLDWLKTNLNLTITGRVLPGDQTRQVYQNMLASGQMTDIVNITDMQDVQDGINAGLFLDLEQYKNLLPNLYNNPVYRNMIQFNKDTYGNGTALYVINEQTGKSNTLNFQPVIRWDLYENSVRPGLIRWTT